ncbi:hypothetical protein HMPREF9086_2698 [Enterobacter hormaechei ATCC 49162]|nr:hypothetical protein HMPREF9086_2698 [Enterobacter hormaechei ATCC 49162]
MFHYINETTGKLFLFVAAKSILQLLIITSTAFPLCALTLS